MIRGLLVAWGLLGVLCGAALSDPDTHNLQPIISAMGFPGVATRVWWRPCGPDGLEINGYYNPRTQVVIMCNGLEALPDTIIQSVLAHELAHGVIMQLDIPVMGSHEVAADELSMYILHLIGRDDSILGLARFYALRAQPELPDDPHPSDARRVYSAVEVTRGMASEYYRQLNRTWSRLLGTYGSR